MRCHFLATSVLLLLLCPAAPARQVVCMMVPGLPWHYGPYQHQQYLLSKVFHEAGHKVYWMALSEHQAHAEGVWDTWEEYLATLATVWRARSRRSARWTT